MIDNIKIAIKSVPFLYELLVPGVRFLRRTIAPFVETDLDKFRRYCAKIPSFISDPVFVKVGANDGTTGDPCSDILLGNGGWKGLLIEPVPYCFERLQANFQDRERFSVERVAIGSTVGETTFYYVDPKARECFPNLPYWFDQLGSFDRNHIIKHLNGVLESFIVECTVEVSTLSDVLKRNNIRRVHLLHIDTEGHDWEVLKTLDFPTQAPLIIFLEHEHLSNSHRGDMLELLYKNGYSVRDCGADYFAVNKKAWPISRLI